MRKQPFDYGAQAGDDLMLTHALARERSRAAALCVIAAAATLDNRSRAAATLEIRLLQNGKYPIPGRPRKKFGSV
jgi:hypothetical protein